MSVNLQRLVICGEGYIPSRLYAMMALANLGRGLCQEVWNVLESQDNLIVIAVKTDVNEKSCATKTSDACERVRVRQSCPADGMMVCLLEINEPCTISQVWLVRTAERGDE